MKEGIDCEKNKYGGCLGNATYKGNERLYSVWRSMLNRCYDENHVRHDAYKNVIVCAEWFCFENFLKEAKDKQINTKEKVYSKSTCIWMPKEINNACQPNRCKPFLMIKPDRTEYLYYSQHLCAREHGLNVININQCLNGTKNTQKQ